MKILACDYLVTCDENFSILTDAAIAFDEKIIALDSLENIKKKYHEPIEYLGHNSVVMPGLINTHVHLEFSSNKTTLHYGNFIQWLFSVIANREELIEKATNQLISNELDQMIKNGTTTIGAISSYGFDMEPCVKSPINVVYFTEVLGSKPEMIDTLFADFKAKLKTAKNNESNKFLPAIAIHSPYSTHPFLIREVLKIAKENNYPVSAHFQESPSENEWLNYSTGEFSEFFEQMLNQKTSLQKPNEFLNLFKNTKNLSFTHCVEANEDELQQIHDLGASVIHCPNSNRLLNNSILNLSYLDNIPLAVGTDGLSSNHTLNLFEEIRNAFYMHTNFEPEELAKKLLLASTTGGAKALGLKKKGVLKTSYDSDIISFNLPDSVNNLEQLPITILLHNSQTTHTYIGGKDETI
jgi:cytosine/adenosine deaminase-related metal-dependent hydrolase